MKRKNILFAYITPFHPNKGGIGRVTHQLTLELQRRGYNVFLFNLSKWNYYKI